MFSVNTNSREPKVMAGDQEIRQITFDPMDHFGAAVITTRLAPSPSDREKYYTQLATISGEESIGGKWLVLIPKEDKLPVETKGSAFQPLAQADTRFRQCDRETLLKQTQQILEKYPAETKLLDAKLTPKQGYITHKTINRFIVENANFIPSKMLEEKQEDERGNATRFEHTKVQPLFLAEDPMGPKPRLVGVIRALSVGYGVAYLSDETVLQNIIPFDSFTGKDENEKRYARWQFLLAYLFHQTAKTNETTHFVIIAAKGRELMYEALGFKKFEATFAGEFSAYVRFSNPGPLLKKTKETLIQEFCRVNLVYWALQQHDLNQLESYHFQGESFTNKPLIDEAMNFWNKDQTQLIAFTKKLIEFGADVNMDQNGYTPLFGTLLHSLEITRMLIEAKANVDTLVAKSNSASGTFRDILTALDKYVNQNDPSDLSKLFPDSAMDYFKIFTTPAEKAILSQILEIIKAPKLDNTTEKPAISLVTGSSALFQPASTTEVKATAAPAKKA